jgi:glutamyl-tRNA reductase
VKFYGALFAASIAESNMTTSGEVIAIAGAGDLGKRVCEALLNDQRYRLVVLSRKV